jgi:hypothetical protein
MRKLALFFWIQGSIQGLPRGRQRQKIDLG